MIDSQKRVQEWDFRLREVPSDPSASVGEERPLRLLGPGTWIGLAAGVAFALWKVPPYLRATLGWTQEACEAFGFAAALALGSTGAVLGCVVWHWAMGGVRRVLGKDAPKGR